MLPRPKAPRPPANALPIHVRGRRRERGGAIPRPVASGGRGSRQVGGRVGNASWIAWSWSGPRLAPVCRSTHVDLVLLAALPAGGGVDGGPHVQRPGQP